MDGSLRDDVYVYNVITSSWHAAPLLTLPQPLCSFAICYLAPYVYIFGGITSLATTTSRAIATASCWCINPCDSAPRWRAITPLPVPWYGDGIMYRSLSCSCMA